MYFKYFIDDLMQMVELLYFEKCWNVVILMVKIFFGYLQLCRKRIIYYGKRIVNLDGLIFLFWRFMRGGFQFFQWFGFQGWVGLSLCYQFWFLGLLKKRFRCFLEFFCSLFGFRNFRVQLRGLEFFWFFYISFVLILCLCIMISWN